MNSPEFEVLSNAIEWTEHDLKATQDAMSYYVTQLNEAREIVENLRKEVDRLNKRLAQLLKEKLNANSRR